MPRQLQCKTHGAPAAITFLYGRKGEESGFATVQCGNPEHRASIIKATSRDELLKNLDDFEYVDAPAPIRTLAEAAEDRDLTAEERALVFAADVLLKQALAKYGLRVQVV